MQLVAVQGAIQLDAPTARAWLAFEAAVRAEHGVDLNITSPAGGYRSPEMVLDMWLHRDRYGIPASQPIARPRSLGGGGSVHENGRCVDINNHEAVPRKSLVALADRFGFTFTIASEPWHVQHNGSMTAGGAGGFTPIPDVEDDMPTVIVAEGHYFIRDGVNFISIENGNELEVARRWFPGDVEAFALGEVRVLEAMAGRDMSATDAAIVKAAVVAALAESPLEVSDADVTAIADQVHAKLDFPTTITFDPPAVTGTLS